MPGQARFFSATSRRDAEPGFGAVLIRRNILAALMLGFPAKLPVSEPERLWVDEGFRRLQKMLGHRRMMDAEMVLPAAKFFPDHYDKTPVAAEKLCQRVCGYMRVDIRGIELEVFADETEELREMLPHWSGNSSGCAGLYMRDRGEEEDRNEKRMVVAIRSTQLQDPLSLVATVAHELGHVILLGGGLMNPSTPDHEPMTDLLTVFLGLGIFTANSAGRFTQFQDNQRQGWSMQRLGYLPEQVFGYALARFGRERGEEKPSWAKYLSTNVGAYYKRSSAWLAKHGAPVISAKPIK
jgi:hypothetical protein